MKGRKFKNQFYFGYLLKFVRRIWGFKKYISFKTWQIFLFTKIFYMCWNHIFQVKKCEISPKKEPLIWVCSRETHEKNYIHRHHIHMFQIHYFPSIICLHSFIQYHFIFYNSILTCWHGIKWSYIVTQLTLIWMRI
jgi:hypothetical protein